MKRKLLVFILFAFPQLIFGQDAYERYTNFFAVELTPSASSSGIGIIPTFSVYRAGHKIDVGPYIKIVDVWEDGPGIIGGYLSYKFFPNQRKKLFNLYFGYHTIFSASNRGKKFPAITNQAFDITNYPDKAFMNEQMLGIGFDAQLGNGFYMFNDFNAGALFTWYTYDDAATENEIRSTGMVRIGLAYNVGHKRAK